MAKDDDDDKLGTSVTYMGEAPEVEINGVKFKKGEPVDLADHMDEERAKQVAKKLAGNRMFQVEGGPKRDKLPDLPPEEGSSAALQREADAAKVKEDAAQKAKDEAEADEKKRADAAKQQQSAPKPQAGASPRGGPAPR